MASKPRHKMPIEERAKQFMPFAALKGLPEALAAKEKLSISEPALTPPNPDLEHLPSSPERIP